MEETMGYCRTHIQIVNVTDKPLYDIRLFHRYDRELYDEGSWEHIPAGAATYDDSLRKDVNARFRSWHAGDDYWQLTLAIEGRRYELDAGLLAESFEAHDTLPRSADNETTEVVIFRDRYANRWCVTFARRGSYDHRDLPLRHAKSFALQDVGWFPSLDDWRAGVAAGRTGSKRPMYVIAHECNSLDDVGAAFENRANAIECDVMYARSARSHGTGRKQWYVAHPDNLAMLTPETPQDVAPNAPTLLDWILEVERQATEYPDRMCFVIFDIKSYDAEAIRELYHAICTELHSVSAILTTSSIAEAGCFSLIQGALRQRDGLAIDFENDPERVIRFFEDRKVTRFWYANGINSNMVSASVSASIKEAGALRDKRRRVSKLYAWTYSSDRSIENLVDDADRKRGNALDGIMVEIGSIGATLRHVENRGFVRLARPADPLWSIHEHC